MSIQSSVQQCVPPVPADLHRLYGSSRSLSQDLGSLKDLRSSSNDMSSSKDDKDALNNYPSFSSYLATRTKSPARPPLTKSSSLHGTSSTSSSARREEEEEKTNYKEEDEPKSTKNSSESKSWKPSALLSVSDSKSSSSSVSPTSERRVLKSSSLSSISEGKPPKPPSRLKPTIKLGDFKDTPTEDKPKKNILSLRVSPTCFVVQHQVENAFIKLLFLLFIRSVFPTGEI